MLLKFRLDYDTFFRILIKKIVYQCIYSSLNYLLPNLQEYTRYSTVIEYQKRSSYSLATKYCVKYRVTYLHTDKVENDQIIIYLLIYMKSISKV